MKKQIVWNYCLSPSGPVRSKGSMLAQNFIPSCFVFFVVFFCFGNTSDFNLGGSFIWVLLTPAPSQLSSRYAGLFCRGNFIGIVYNWLFCLFPLASELVEKLTRWDEWECAVKREKSKGMLQGLPAVRLLQLVEPCLNRKCVKNSPFFWKELKWSAILAMCACACTWGLLIYINLVNRYRKTERHQNIEMSTTVWFQWYMYS